MKEADAARRELRDRAVEEHAVVSRRFFKTGAGQYGEGDIFIGVKMPEIRQVARNFARLLSLDATVELLKSEIHEERMLALVILTLQFNEGSEKYKREVHQVYCSNRNFVNNWDLVDNSAPYLVGRYLLSRSRIKLYRWAESLSLWDRRIAIVSTFAFIRQGDYVETLSLSKMLLGDREDLLHKAAGWMLREVGKRSRESLDLFLREYCHLMPRTMLRYAIEKHSLRERQIYLKK